MKRILSILIALICVGGIVSYVAYSYLSNRIIYNESYVNGNSAGNLYNGGLFCENNGTVFFANPDDENRLYCMDLNGDNLKKLSDDRVMYINADSHYIYYVRRNGDIKKKEQAFAIFAYANNSLCRIPRKGGRVTILDPDPCIFATLIGNYVYYLHYDTETATTLYKIGIDGKDKQQVSKDYMFTCSTLGQYFYYNNMQTDGSIYEYDTATDTTRQIYECNSYKPIVTSDNNVYYMDVDQNNALVHTNIQFGNPNVLTHDSIDLYNVYGSYVYYQKYSENGSALCMIKNDGSDARELLSGDYSNIHVTSYDIYFTDFHTGEVLYTPTSNPGQIYSFHPGVQKKK